LDERIGYHFLYPGCGYGGSCFPKDVQALRRTAAENGVPMRVIDAVEAANEAQKHLLLSKIIARFGADLAGKRFALWGLSFKPNTDDMREAPSRVLMEGLWQRGADVIAFDPVAAHETRRIYGNHPQLSLADTPEAALVGADALVIVTEWKVFKSPDFGVIANTLKQPVIFDGRNLYDPQQMRELGLEYFSIGRQ
jgi:UDPglucose 6-dehydrogenase